MDQLYANLEPEKVTENLNIHELSLWMSLHGMYWSGKLRETKTNNSL